MRARDERRNTKKRRFSEDGNKLEMPWAVTSGGSGLCGKPRLGAWIYSVFLLSLGRWPK